MVLNNQLKWPDLILFLGGLARNMMEFEFAGTELHCIHVSNNEISEIEAE